MDDLHAGAPDAMELAQIRAHAIELLLGVPPEESYDRMARLAAASLGTTMAIVSVSYDGRQIVKGSIGVSGRSRAWRSVPTARGAVDLAIQQGRLVVVDATHDIASAGFQPARPRPRRSESAHALAVAPFSCRADRTTGAVCVADPDPARQWSDEDRALLADLAEAMRIELDLRREVIIRRDTQEALVHITLHDELTGLPNRALLSERLRNAIARAQRDPSAQFAVLFLDLDRFKVVNDSIGHLEGDAMLVVVAERLLSAIRPEDTVARLGGDEFAVLLESLGGPTDAAVVAERIQTALAAPIDLGGYEVFTSASIGIVLSTSTFLETELPEHLLRSADMAMYKAKDAGRARHALFDRTMHGEALRRLQLETDLRRALERDEFRVVYQPVVSLRTGRITGAEALLRWQRPQQGLVSPAAFLPLAEDTGLIVGIGEWALAEACRQVQEWSTPGDDQPPLCIAVNLSIKQFLQPSLAARVGEILTQSGLAPERLILEVTESVVIDRPDKARETLLQLKALGISVHMDDFGTGYSSLSYLQQLPLDGLKVDRAFVSVMDDDERSRQLVQTVLQLARGVGLRTVAEGVTTLAQLAALRELECDSGQGYLFSAPLDASAMGELVLAAPVW